MRYMSLKEVILVFVGEKWLNRPFFGKTRALVPIPKAGTSTHGQRQSGTDTDQGGTGTDASSNLDFYALAILSPRFVHR